MSLYQPLQRERDKRWNYTRSDSSGTYAVGRCSGQGPHGHTDGHESAEAAVRCYRDHELDQLKQGERPDEQKRCVVCGEWTTTRALMDLGDSFTLYVACREHATREHIAPIHHKEKAAVR